MRLPAYSLEFTNLYFEDGALPYCQMGCRWKSAEGWKLSCVGKELRSDIGCRKAKDNSRGKRLLAAHPRENILCREVQQAELREELPCPGFPHKAYRSP